MGSTLSRVESFRRGPLEFRVLDQGSVNAETIVLLHGFPQNVNTWNPLATRLSTAGYRVLALEQRGYSPGARPRWRWEYRLENLVDDALALFDAAEVERTHLVGHDLGGLVAWALAHCAPEMLRTLSVISTPHPRAFASTVLSTKQSLMYWYMLFFQLPGAPEMLMRYRDGHLMTKFLVQNGLCETIAEEYSQQMVQDPGLAKGSLNWYRALTFDLANLMKIGKITIPTLYIVGDRDDFVSRKAAMKTKDWITSTYQFRSFADTTHWIPEAHHELLATSLLEFFQQCQRDKADDDPLDKLIGSGPGLSAATDLETLRNEWDR